MTPEHRFLALVAKVEHTLDVLSDFERPFEPSTMEYDLDWTSRALKGEIMRHEPIERYKGQLFVCGYCRDEDGCFEIDWPCKPFLDMEAEVGK